MQNSRLGPTPLAVLRVFPPRPLRVPDASSAEVESSRIGEMRTAGFSLGVDGDLEGARVAAKLSAKKDHEEFSQRLG